MNKIQKWLVLLVLVLMFTILSGCTEREPLSPTMWRKGILEGVTVEDNYSSIIVNLTGYGTYTYQFKERLDILNSLKTGEYHEFGIYIVDYKFGIPDESILVEIYDVNSTLVWKHG